MRRWWQNLTTREQQYMLAMLVVLAVFLVYMALLKPFVHKINELESDTIYNKELYVWLEEQKPILSSLRKSKVRNNSSFGSLFSLIENKFIQPDLKLYNPEVRTIDQGKLLVNFKEVPFHLLIESIKYINLNYGVDVKTMQVNNFEKNGLVQVSLVLGT